MAKSKKKSKKRKSRKKSAREISKEISQGTRKPQHLGKKTFAVLHQEIFSLKNSFKPQTMTNTDWIKFSAKLDSIKNGISKLDKKDQRSLNNEIEKLSQGKA